MACETTSGRLDFSCKTSVGGLKTLYILEGFDKDLKANSTIANSLMSATSSANTVFQFDLNADGNTFNEDNETSRETGTSLFVPNGTFSFKKQDNLSQDLFENLTKMRAQVIVEDHNGGLRLVGLENGVDFTVATVSGGAMADLNGYNVSFTGRERSLACYVNPALVSTSATEFAVSTAVVDPS